MARANAESEPAPNSCRGCAFLLISLRSCELSTPSVASWGVYEETREGGWPDIRVISWRLGRLQASTARFGFCLANQGTHRTYLAWLRVPDGPTVFLRQLSRSYASQGPQQTKRLAPVPGCQR